MFRPGAAATDAKQRPGFPTKTRGVSLPYHHDDGRGADVGRDLGVTAGLAVGVGLGVAVGVSVGEGVSLGVGVGLPPVIVKAYTLLSAAK